MSHKVAVVLIHGLGGSATSPGIDQLANEIKVASKDIVVLHPYDQSQWSQALADIKKYTVEKLVVIGYSMGANATTFIANGLAPREVALLVAIQPTVWENAQPVGKNVIKAIEFYNPNFSETAGFGARKLIGALEYDPNHDSHPYADNDPAVHHRILSEIHRLLAG
jgi:predicted alpha/beta-fold hydrolase